MFQVARVGLGALGIVSTVTLQVVPAFAPAGRGGADAGRRGARRPRRPRRRERPLRVLLGAAHGLGPHQDQQPHRRAPRAAGRGGRSWRDDLLLENYAFGALCRLGRLRPRWIPRLAKALPSSGRTDVRRPELPRLRQPPPRALLRDGVRHPAGRLRRGAQPGAGLRRGRAGCCSASRSRSASPPPTTSRCRRARRAPAATSPCTCSRAWPYHPYFEGVEAHHGRLRRPAPLGQAPLPDRGDAGAPLPGLGSASRRCEPGSTRRVASPTPTPVGCSGNPERADRPLSTVASARRVSPRARGPRR